MAYNIYVKQKHGHLNNIMCTIYNASKLFTWTVSY